MVQDSCIPWSDSCRQCLQSCLLLFRNEQGVLAHLKKRLAAVMRRTCMSCVSPWSTSCETKSPEPCPPEPWSVRLEPGANLDQTSTQGTHTFTHTCTNGEDTHKSCTHAHTSTQYTQARYYSNSTLHEPVPVQFLVSALTATQT
jgi:hypothetical protein